MKKIALGIAATTCLVLTGCGAGPSGQALNSASTNTSTLGQQNTTATSATNTAANTTSPNTTSSVSDSLQPYTGFQQQGISVNIPQGWVSTTKTGGNYTAVTFSNPTDSKEQVRVVYSTCVGCYMTSSGKPDPTRVIGEKNTSNVQVSGANGLTATYDFTPSDSQYPGTGQVQVSNNESGYTEIDVVLNSQNQDLRDAILKSFHYAS